MLNSCWLVNSQNHYFFSQKIKKKPRVIRNCACCKKSEKNRQTLEQVPVNVTKRQNDEITHSFFFSQKHVAKIKANQTSFQWIHYFTGLRIGPLNHFFVTLKKALHQCSTAARWCQTTLMSSLFWRASTRRLARLSGGEAAIKGVGCRKSLGRRQQWTRRKMSGHWIFFYYYSPEC